MTSKRDNTLDCACGILIIHMILGHIFQWPQLTTTHFYQWMNILYFFMPWFFFKAGIFYKKTPVKKVFSTSFHRLIVPFIALSLIGHAFLCISLVQEGGHTWQDFLINPMKDILLLGSTTGNFPLWFLLSLFFTKILYSLLNTQIPPTYITGISCLSCLVIYWIHIQYPTYLPNTVCGLFFFSIGYQLQELQYKRIIFFLSALIYISTLILTPSFVDMRSNLLLSGYYQIWLIGAIAGCITLNNICSSAKKHLPPILCTIGYRVHTAEEEKQAEKEHERCKAEYEKEKEELDRLYELERQARKESLQYIENCCGDIYKEEFYKLKYCSTVVYMVPRA